MKVELTDADGYETVLCGERLVLGAAVGVNPGGKVKVRFLNLVPPSTAPEDLDRDVFRVALELLREVAGSSMDIQCVKAARAALEAVEGLI